MVIKWLLWRPNRLFISAQPFNHLRLASIVALNSLMYVFIVNDDDWEINGVSVARLKFFTRLHVEI
jgi:hypothetical protein